MKRHWIGGEWMGQANREPIDIVNPATEEVFEQVLDGSREDADAAVVAANKAFEIWRRMTAVSRGELLHEVADRLKARTEEIARILTQEGGKPLKENIDEVG
ncbi:MAG: aldehyde dehydrogenase family protein, partial [Bacteroidota bacterium]